MPDRGWRKYVQRRKAEDLNEIIESEHLKPEETEKFIESSFRDGQVRTTGTDIDKILPPMSRFGGGNRQEKRRREASSRRSKVSLNGISGCKQAVKISCKDLWRIYYLCQT